MKKMIAAVLVLMLLWPSIAYADMKVIPAWTEKQCGTDTFACYSFDDAKGLLKLDLDLQLKFKEYDVLEKDNDDLKKALSDAQAALKLSEEDTARLKTRLDEKQKVLDDTLVQYEKANESSIWSGKVLPWVIGIVVVAIAAGFVGGVYLGKKL